MAGPGGASLGGPPERRAGLDAHLVGLAVPLPWPDRRWIRTSLPLRTQAVGPTTTTPDNLEPGAIGTVQPPTRPRIRLALLPLAAIALLAMVTGCSSSASEDGSGEGRLVVRDASIDWPANPVVASVQLSIENDTTTDDVLVDVTSAAAGDVSVHRSVIDDEGLSTMEPVERLDVPAGETVAFEPGGLHVMLRDLTAPIEVGDEVALTFEFERSGTRTVVAPVIEPGSMGEMAPHDD